MNEALLRYWSFARQTLRLSEAEFWALTPAEFQLLADDWRSNERAADYRAALVCMVLANCHRNPEKRPEPFTVADFMPGPVESAPVGEQSWETQKAIFAAFAEAAKINPS